MGELVKLEETEELNLIDQSKAKKIKALFEPMVKMLEDFEGAYNEIILKSKEGIDQELMSKAKRLRLDIAQIRIEGEKARKSEKEEYLRAGKAIDGANNILKWAVQDREKNLKEIEEHFDRLAEEARIKLQSERVELLSPYIEDAEERDLASMDADVWEAYLSSKKKDYEDRIEAERQAEFDRIEAEKKEREENERIRLENERLKKEKEAEAKRIAKLEADRKKKEASLNKKIEKERKEHQEKIDAEKKRVANLEKIEKERVEAEKLKEEELLRLKKERALAPEKERMNLWVDSFSLPELPGKKNDKSALIQSKFDAFKVWAKKEIKELELSEEAA